MKIRAISIQNYNQFKELNLDLTYPNGHDLAGLPLNKVCIIGQSGTGKTTLLELFRNICVKWKKEVINNAYEIINNDKSKIEIGLEEILDNGILVKYSKEINRTKGQTSKYSAEKFDIDLDEITGVNKINNKLNLYYLFYFPAQADSNKVKSYISNGLNSSSKLENRDSKNKRSFFDALFESCYFGFQDSIEIALSGLENAMEEYFLDERKMRLDLTYEAEKKEINIVKKINEWKSKNPSPFDKVLTSNLSKIIEKFGMVPTFLKPEYEDESAVQNKNYSFLFYHQSTKRHFDFNDLSSGIRQLLRTNLPLITHQPERSIIFIDEPENSLYPDVQQELIKLYSSVGVENQIIVATHSPLIASQFEPWEIIELKFNQEGNIYQELNYDVEKGRTKESYYFDSRYLAWDSILMKLFDIKTDGNRNYRVPLLQKFAELDAKFHKIKNDPSKFSIEERQETINRYHDLAKKLDWKI